ncbi:MAG TPA: ComF family protein [Sphingomonas sp.]|nr:ComF family protein [Sphingomonas sp.]
MRRRTVATPATHAAIEDFGWLHGAGLVPAHAAADKRAMRLLSHARRASAAIVAFALPPRCPGCGAVVAEDHVFCLGCWQALDFLGGPACVQCGEPVALAFDDISRCGACLADPPPFDRARAAVAYGPIARALALKLKYGRRPGVALTMARPMRRVAGAMLDGALVAPVPLHRRRLWWRGYNQAALIARALVRDGAGELALDLLDRPRPTPILRGLSRLQRQRAVAGAFRVGASWKQSVKGRRVVLIDDVYTTGATAKGCARVLKRAGASEVSLLCWARVVHDRDDAR